MSCCCFLLIAHLTLSSFISWSYSQQQQQLKQQQQQQQQATCLEPYCYCTDAYTLRCSNFTSFDQLDFRRTNNRIFKAVELRPLVPQLDLNERLTFHGLRLSGRLSISNVAALNAFYNPFRQIVYDRLDISFFNSHFRFVGAVGTSGNQLGEQSILDKCELTAQAVNFDYVFSDLNVNEFVMCNVYFPAVMCPILFRNSNIKNMIVNDPIGAYGFAKLHTPNNDPIYVLNTNINQIDFTYSAENVVQPQWLDADYIINPELFVRTDRININSARRLVYIKEDTFERLGGVRKFELNNVRLKDLLTYNRQWLKNLNYHMIPFDLDYVSLNQSLGNNVFQLLVWVNDDWQFNEEKDICLFRDFPHHRLVFPFLLFSRPDTLPCTCTIYWLYKYFNRYQSLYNLNQDVVPLHCFKSSHWDRCHFETLFQTYCPKDKPDPDESYTTLTPSIEHIPSTTCCTPTNPATTYYTTSSYPSSSHITYVTTPIPTFWTSATTSSGYLTSSSSYLVDLSNCSFSTAAFYLAIALCIVAALITAALALLYYKVFSSGASKSGEQPPSGEDDNQDQQSYQNQTTSNGNDNQAQEIEIDFEAELERESGESGGRARATSRHAGRDNRMASSRFKYEDEYATRSCVCMMPRQLIVTDLVVDTSLFCTCSGVAVPCDGACSQCNQSIYI